MSEWASASFCSERHFLFCDELMAPTETVPFDAVLFD